MKTCSICNKIKDLSSFNIYRYYKDERKYRSYCKQCQAEKDKKVYEDRINNSKVITEKKCPMCLRTLPSDSFSKANGSSTGLFTYCKECQKVKDREYKSKESYKKHHRLCSLVRYHTERSSVSNLTQAEWENTLSYFNHCCAYCKTKFDSDNPANYEHFVPVSKGGGFTADNIIPSCKSCNSSKRDKDFYKWAEEVNLPKSTIYKIQQYFSKAIPSQTYVS